MKRRARSGKQIRDHVVKTTLTDQELAMFNQATSMLGLTMADMIRSAVHGYFVEQVREKADYEAEIKRDNE